MSLLESLQVAVKLKSSVIATGSHSYCSKCTLLSELPVKYNTHAFGDAFGDPECSGGDKSFEYSSCLTSCASPRCSEG